MATTYYDAVRPFVERALRDDDVHDSVLRAWNAARSVYGELSGEDPLSVATKLSSRDRVRDDLDTTVQSLSEALVRMSGQRKHRSPGWGLFLVFGIVAFALFNPATGPSTRKWVRDHLFGSEEEFDYASNMY
jgi:hypothetical protein